MICQGNVNSTLPTQLPHKVLYIVAILGHNHFESPNRAAQFNRTLDIQSDQQESKSEQALQIIGHVVAKSYAHKRSKHGRRQFMVLNAT
jgi:hypothetical protein